MIRRILELLWRYIALIVIVFTPSFSYALCSYNGIDHSKTTLSQEFKDSQWVVRARVIRVKHHRPDDGEAWSLYQLSVIDFYKGITSKKLELFTYRNSGGFYLEDAKGTFEKEGYLLFLNINKRASKLLAKHRLVDINYACGVSRAWKDISPAEKQELSKLSHQKSQP